MRTIIFALATLCLGFPAFAQSNFPTDFTVEGRLYDAGGSAYNQSGVTIMLEVVDDSNSNCVLYREVHTGLNLSSAAASAQGVFALRLGTGSPRYNPTTLSTIFTNTSGMAGILEASGGACSPSPTSSTHRMVKVKVWDIAGGTWSVGTSDTDSHWDALSPDTKITVAPQAMVADRAESLQGHQANEFLLTNMSASSSLSQSNVESIFSIANFGKLQSLLSGTSTQYITATPSSDINMSSHKVTNLSAPTAATDAATKGYTDTKLGGSTLDMTGVSVASGDGKTLVWDQGSNSWIAKTPLSYVGAGNGLIGGPITSTGTLSVDVGTTANQILQLDPNARIPAVDGSLLIGVHAAKIGTYAVSTATPSANQVLGFNFATLQWEPMSAASGTLTGLSGDVNASGAGVATAIIQPNAVTSAKINNIGVAVNRLLITDATSGTTVGYSTCALGEVLQWTATGWACRSVALMLGSSSVTAGTYGNSTQVTQVGVDTQGRVQSLTNVNIDFPVTSVAGRTGAVLLTASDVGGLGSAAFKDVGTGVNNVLQFTTAGQLPAVDGSLLTGVKGDAITLQGKAVQNTTPGDGQVLTWSATNTRWEPATVAAGAASQWTTSGSDIFYPTGNVGIGTPAPNVSLDLGSKSDAIALPFGVTAQRPLTPSEGYVRYNSNQNGVEAYVNGTWQQLASGTSPTATENGKSLRWNNTTKQFEWFTPGVLSGSSNEVFYSNGAGGASSSSSLNFDGSSLRAPRLIPQLGSSSAPSIANQSDTSTGINFPGSQTIALVTQGSDRLTVLSSGNVGIGTTNPGAPLDVSGTIRTDAICDRTGANCKTISGGWGGAGTVTNVSSANGYIGITSGTSAPVLTANVGTSAGTLAAGDDSRITGALQQATSFSGDVSGAYNATNVNKIKGKSVTAPTTAGQILIYDGSSTFTSATLGGDATMSATGAVTLANSSSTRANLGLGSAATLTAGSAANNVVQLDGSGNLGVGTAAPVDLISLGAVNASATHSSLNLSNTALSGASASGTYIGANPASASADFINYQVGGTTKFKVDKNGKITGDGSGLTGISAAPAGGNAQIQFNNSGAMGASSNLVWDDTNGRLGIGATTPTAPLQVGNGAAASNLAAMFNGQINAMNSANAIVTPIVAGNTYNFANAGSSIGFQVGSNPNYQGMMAGVIESTSPANGQLQFHTLNTSSLTQRMVITSAGNVGIGTPTPGALLDVAGDAKARHLAGSQTISAPIFGAGAGTSPTLNTFTGTDVAQKIVFTTGSSPSTGAGYFIFQFNFSTSYVSTPPACVFSPANANSAALYGGLSPWINTNAGYYQLMVGSSALFPSTQYAFHIHCFAQ